MVNGRGLVSSNFETSMWSFKGKTKENIETFVKVLGENGEEKIRENERWIEENGEKSVGVCVWKNVKKDALYRL